MSRFFSCVSSRWLFFILPLFSQPRQSRRDKFGILEALTRAQLQQTALTGLGHVFPDLRAPIERRSSLSTDKLFNWITAEDDDVSRLTLVRLLILFLPLIYLPHSSTQSVYHLLEFRRLPLLLAASLHLDPPVSWPLPLANQPVFWCIDWYCRNSFLCMRIANCTQFDSRWAKNTGVTMHRCTI